MPLVAFPLPPRLRRRRGVLAVASVLALSAVLAALPLVRTAMGDARLRAADRTLTVATWNMCGVRQWGCADTGSAAAKRRAVERLVDDGADVVLLQEACATHAESVRRALGGSWRLSFRPYTWRDSAGRTGTVRCEGRGQGIAGLALLSARPLSSVRSVPSLQPEVGLRRGILCATVAAVGVRVCNAHLSVPGGDRAHPGREYRDDQLEALIAAVPQRRTVFGGDFNVNPPGRRNPSSWVWPSAAYRAYRECDQASATDRSGRPTHVSGHKLDYLFTGLPRSGCAVRETGVSDHRALLIGVDTG
ncbi:endonuclease/exonuclease/phosphatase family protein [Streptomyces sp. TRM S81-3]|uniref:Endonuclease/exonuclease/phosphatase family protein n=1 Tax=Streptomyces griseicoloratus TaxID=2752516 RepID=A0A926L711_9ACTN|nr:endonuclease/exonuclease/phosphatase family protein [Streptomyces griseicoloratus]MBD0423748.1 endonuclease/exonuclease/phosphatase family protein [Streptomyces griseicoloratus]